MQAYLPVAMIAIFVLLVAISYAAAARWRAPAKDGRGVAATDAATDVPAIGQQRPLQAARESMKAMLPFVLVALFALVPSVSASAFSVFSCEEFGGGRDDSRSFLYADYAVECDTSEHEQLIVLSAWLIALWPVGVAALFCGLLVAVHTEAAWVQPIRHAVTFLHDEYTPNHIYWELFELLRKLVLNGFVFLIPQKHTLLRLLLAILISISHLILLQAARPYKQESTSTVAIASSMLLLCTLIAALVVSMRAALPEDQVYYFFGFESIMPLAIIIFVMNCSVVVAATIIIFVDARTASRELFRVRREGGSDGCGGWCSDELPVLSLAKDKQWHLFLSHSFPEQSIALTIKDRLARLLPGISVFAA